MDDEESLTAYHEAGHATIGFALGGKVEAIQLGGESEVSGVRQYGDCKIAWHAVGSDLDVHCQREILTTLAGPAAEMLYAGREIALRSFGPWEQDYHTAWFLLDRFPISSNEKDKLLKNLIQQLKSILDEDDCWAAVAALADALLAHEYLEAEETEEILSYWLVSHRNRRIF